jgi:Outer membrane protein beta-barrel domain
MNKRLISLPIFFLCAATAWSQAAVLVLLLGDKAATENFHFTIDIGASLATLPGVDEGDMQTGFYYGLGTYIKINDNWAFTPGLMPVSPRGVGGIPNFRLDTANAVNTSESELRLKYIDLPLQIQRRLNERFYVRAGPQIGFLTKAIVRSTGDLGTGETFTIEDDVKGDFEAIDVSFPIDVGIVFAKPRGFKGVDLRLRYTPGFTEVFKNTDVYSSTNSSFQFFLSLPFVSVEPKTP